jgi:hypothetical protein
MSKEQDEREAFRVYWLNRRGLDVDSYTGKTFWEELCVPGSVTWERWETWQARASLANEGVQELVRVLELSKEAILDANRNGFTRGIESLQSINDELAKYKAHGG